MASARVGLALWMLALGALAPAAGCGDSKSETPPDGSSQGGKADSGSAGEGGAPTTGGDNGEGGADAQGGSGTTGGTPSDGGFAGRTSGGGGNGGGPLGTGGASGGFDGFGGAFGFGGTSSGGSIGSGGTIFTSGGASTCVEGAPCKCKKLSGTTKCSAGAATCECPPANECALAPSSCFEPCGGEPFGSWVLEDSCFGAGDVSPGCTGGLVRGTSATTDLRLRILDGGSFHVIGEEVWDVLATVPIECLSLQSVNACSSTVFFRSEPMLFSFARSLSCTANACGVCDCAAEMTSTVDNYGQWSREGNLLQLDGVKMPYCAEEDTLWIGGSGPDGVGKAAYKFKKQSCTGTPVACAKRKPESCTDDCSPGACVRTTGTAPGCERALSASECSVLQNCTWDADLCSGTAYESCSFQNCESVPGCTWGPPEARCAGTPVPCEERDVTQCNGGCSVAKCYSFIGQDTVSCASLSTTDCAKAAGCTVSAGTCTGSTRCSTQTDANVCSSLDSCFFESHCAGGPPPECSEVTVEDCQAALGCRIEW